MGACFTLREPKKICVYGLDQFYWSATYSPEDILMRYLGKNEVTPDMLEASKKSNLSLGCRSIQRTNRPASRNQTFNFVVIDTVEMGFGRGERRGREANGVARVVLLFAKHPDDMHEMYVAKTKLETMRHTLKETMFSKYISPDPNDFHDQSGFRAWQNAYVKSPVLIFVEQLGKEGAKTEEEFKLELGLDKADFPYHLQAIDLWNNGEGIDKGLKWLKSQTKKDLPKYTPLTLERAVFTGIYS